MQPLEARAYRDAEHARLRGMPRHGRHVGAPAPVSHLRSCGLLRRLEEQARDAALPLGSSSHHHVARARRDLELVLRRRHRDGARRRMTEATVPATATSPWSPLRSALFRNLWLATIVSNVGGWM